MPTTNTKKYRKTARTLPGKKMRISKTIIAKPLAPETKARTLDVVKSYVKRFDETKFAGKSVYVGNFNGSIASAGEIYGILPSVPQTATATAFSRVGDKIKPVSLRVNGSVALGVTGAYKRVCVRVLFLTAKNIKNAAQKTDIDIIHLINDGQTNGGTQFDGTVQKRDFPVNKNLFTVLSDRSYELCQSSLTSVSGNESGPGLGEGVFAVPGFNSGDCNARSWARFSLDLPVPATLMYNAAQGTDPTNYYPFMVVGYTELNTNPASTVTAEVAVAVSSMLRFDDP